VYFSDPDVLMVDPAFNDLTQGNTTIARLWHGDVNGKPILWAEGPAWNSQGRYLLWSDIPNNRQLRWLDDDGHVSVFREPSNNSNGNTFDFQGRQISCEHLMRRVVRYELDGSVTVLADSFQGKRLNSPNDAVRAGRRTRAAKSTRVPASRLASRPSSASYPPIATAGTRAAHCPWS
jgi:gluconolactonase